MCIFLRPCVSWRKYSLHPNLPFSSSYKLEARVLCWLLQLGAQGHQQLYEVQGLLHNEGKRINGVLIFPPSVRGTMEVYLKFDFVTFGIGSSPTHGYICSIRKQDTRFSVVAARSRERKGRLLSGDKHEMKFRLPIKKGEGEISRNGTRHRPAFGKPSMILVQYPDPAKAPRNQTYISNFNKHHFITASASCLPENDVPLLSAELLQLGESSFRSYASSNIITPSCREEPQSHASHLLESLPRQLE